MSSVKYSTKSSERHKRNAVSWAKRNKKKTKLFRLISYTREYILTQAEPKDMFEVYQWIQKCKKDINKGDEK